MMKSSHELNKNKCKKIKTTKLWAKIVKMYNIKKKYKIAYVSVEKYSDTKVHTRIVGNSIILGKHPWCTRGIT